jgi:dTDP-4-amino-4,6-dideoxygalactose transaminase
VPVVVAVDMLGKAADYTSLAPLVEERGIRLLSDAAEAFGAQHRGAPAGSFGDAAALSFNGNKIMTTSGGGMLLTDDARLAAHVRKLSTQAREPVAHYEHTEIGYNYRLSNVLAALGRAQLSRLDAMIARRRRWREGYRELTRELPGLTILGGDEDAEDNCWVTAFLVDPEVAGVGAAELGAALAAEGVETRPVWKPMHLQPVHAKATATLSGAADGFFARGLTLPSGSAMAEADFELVADTIRARLAASR